MKTKVVDDIAMNVRSHGSYEIIERNKELDNSLGGIKTRGVHLAHRQKQLAQLEQIDIPVAEIDTKPFRDDKESGKKIRL